MNTKPQRDKDAPKGERGNALVLTAVFLIVLLAFAAFSIDMGNVYVQRHLIQSGADAAALAAVQIWALNDAVADTVQVGTAVATNNAVQAADIISITPGVWNAANKQFTADSSHNFHNNAVPAVRVIAQRGVPMYFARVLGIHQMNPRVESIAIAGPATAAFGVMPWFKCAQGNQTPQPCEPLVLKYSDINDFGPNDNPCVGVGNFGSLRFPGGSGGDWYRNNVEYGYQGIVRIGDVIDTETGNKVGPTQQGLEARILGAPLYQCDPNNPTVVPSQRLAIVVVTDNQGYQTSKVVVKQFWVFAMDDPVGGQVTGRFLQTYSGTEIDPSKPPVVVGVNTVALVR